MDRPEVKPSGKCYRCLGATTVREPGLGGVLQVIPCPACSEKKYAEYVRGEECKKANAPEKFMDASVTGYRTDIKEQKAPRAAVLDFCQHIDENLASGTGLTLYGPTGCGKTHLMCAVLLGAQRMGYSVWFESEDSIFDSFKAAWDEPADEMAYLKKLQSVRFLGIDDFGIRKPTEYVNERFEAIINGYANEFFSIINIIQAGEIDTVICRR